MCPERQILCCTSHTMTASSTKRWRHSLSLKQTTPHHFIDCVTQRTCIIYNLLFNKISGAIQLLNWFIDVLLLFYWPWINFIIFKSTHTKHNPFWEDQFKCLCVAFIVSQMTLFQFCRPRMLCMLYWSFSLLYCSFHCLCYTVHSIVCVILFIPCSCYTVHSIVCVILFITLFVLYCSFHCLCYTVHYIVRVILFIPLFVLYCSFHCLCYTVHSIVRVILFITLFVLYCSFHICVILFIPLFVLNCSLHCLCYTVHFIVCVIITVHSSVRVYTVHASFRVTLFKILCERKGNKE